MAHEELHFILFSEGIWGKHYKEDVGLSVLALQNHSSNHLLLIPHRQFSN